jgi:hypothetical protein
MKLDVSMKSQDAMEFIEEFPNVNSYIKSLFLHDPEMMFTSEVSSITREIQASTFVTNPNVLNRTISVRISRCKNLSWYLGIKKRPKLGILYESLSPSVQVRIGGKVQTTTALICTENPEWNQDLIFQICIPAGEPTEIEHWVERQNIELSLYDNNISGQTSYNDLIGSASIPLTQVLFSVRKSLWTTLKLSTHDCTTKDVHKPRLDVYFQDKTLESFAYSKVADGIPRIEEVWKKKFPEQMKTDIETKCFSVIPDEHVCIHGLMY